MITSFTGQYNFYFIALIRSIVSQSVNSNQSDKRYHQRKINISQFNDQLVLDNIYSIAWHNIFADLFVILFLYFFFQTFIIVFDPGASLGTREHLVLQFSHLPAGKIMLENNKLF